MEGLMTAGILIAYFVLRGGMAAMFSCRPRPAELHKLLRSHLQELQAAEEMSVNSDESDTSPPVTVTAAEVGQPGEREPEKVVTKGDLEILEPLEPQPKQETFEGDAEAEEDEPAEPKVEESSKPVAEESEPKQVETPGEETGEERAAAVSSDGPVADEKPVPTEVNTDEKHTEEVEVDHEDSATSGAGGISPPIIPDTRPRLTTELTETCHVVRPKLPWEK